MKQTPTYVLSNPYEKVALIPHVHRPSAAEPAATTSIAAPSQPATE
jgi:hypothetical protein